MTAPDPMSANDGRPAGSATQRLRQCVVTREERPADELIRFVADPTGAIAPDLAGKLGGRGVWVAARRDAVTRAVERNLFAKGLKRLTKPSPDLPALVERLMLERLRQALSFAAKAGLVTFGYTKIDAALGRGGVVALVQGSDASDDGAERLQRKFCAISTDANRPSPVIRLLSVAELSLAFGRSNVVHVALSAGGQTQSVLREALRLDRYRQVEAAAAGTVEATVTKSGSSTDSE